MMNKLIMDLSGITKTFPGTVALQDVDFDLRIGEIHALVGQNGAGKSTLVKVLAGIYAKDKGKIVIGGRPIDHLTPRKSHDLGMRFIHQELNLVPQFNVAENIVLGDPYPLRKKTRFIRWQALNTHVRNLLENLGISIDPKRSVQELTVAEQWMVAIARALYSQGKVLVMDEPTSSLTRKEVQELFHLVRSLAAKGTSVIYISHRLEEVFELAQRITVLKDGRKVGTLIGADVDLSKLVQLIVGGKPQDLFPAKEPWEEEREAVLEIEGLTTVDRRLQNVTLSIREGEVVGLTGLLGAGQSALADILFGASRVRFQEGKIRVNGKSYTPRSTHRAITRGIALVPEERRSQGLVTEMKLWENIILPSLGQFVLDPISRLIHYRRSLAESKRQMALLHIQATSPHQQVRYLSGGNQQKVVLAKWLLRTPRLLILNEPTRGIDVSTKAEIYRLVRKLAASGNAILFISSEVEELAGVCNRVLIMRKGCLVTELEDTNLTPSKVMECCYES
ncbi:sugar ABC transporter ATP-binding protein [Candidatus Bipolaricaulota bacterium]|nr:sugar ABC transporter ATP-binding protein [Candidatus Bipolaricaulota bacterium]